MFLLFIHLDFVDDRCVVVDIVVLSTSEYIFFSKQVNYGVVSFLNFTSCGSELQI